MSKIRKFLSAGFAVLSQLLAAGLFCSAADAQQSQSPAGAPAVPNLFRFAGSFHSANPPAGLIGATFAIYAEQEGGTPLWSEVQNVELDSNGAST